MKQSNEARAAELCMEYAKLVTKRAYITRLMRTHITSCPKYYLAKTPEERRDNPQNCLGKLVKSYKARGYKEHPELVPAVRECFHCNRAYILMIHRSAVSKDLGIVKRSIGALGKRISTTSIHDEVIYELRDIH